jgi:transcriptional regulator with XRE-family HTH domain
MSDGTSNPIRYFGQHVRRARLAAGWTLAEFGQRIGYDPGQISRIENGKRPPTELFAQMCDRAFPDRAGWFSEFYAESRTWIATPPWFRSWVEHEQQAATLRIWQLGVLSGLLQTADYARALLRAGRPELLPHEIDRLVELRMRRQEILTRADPPPLTLWSVMDEAVLRRPIGGRETMHAQLLQLIECSALPNVTLLVMPDALGAHAGLDGPFAIFQFETSTRPVVYVEGQAGNLYLEKDDDLRRCQQTMNHILADAPGPDRSLALIRQVAKEMKP